MDWDAIISQLNISVNSAIFPVVSAFRLGNLASEDCARWCGQFYTGRNSSLIVIDQLNKREPSFKRLRNSSGILNVLNWSMQ